MRYLEKIKFNYFPEYEGEYWQQIPGIKAFIERGEVEFGNPGILKNYGGISLHQQSHGESFMSIMQNRFAGKGLYVLDEPEAALSPSRQLAMLALVKRLVDDESQFIISTHSPILMAYPGAQVFELTENGMQSVHYSETSHFKLTKYFLNNPEGVLREVVG